MGHADALRPLEVFAFGLQGRRHHYLGLLELLDRLVAARRHGRAEGAEQVEAAVIFMGGPDQDFPRASPAGSS